MDSDLYLSDDGLEDFNEEELSALEAQAILSATQPKRLPSAKPPPQTNCHPQATEYVTLPTLRSSPSKRNDGPPIQQASSDYGDGDFNETMELWDTAEGPTAPALTRPDGNNENYGHPVNGMRQNGEVQAQYVYNARDYHMADDGDVHMGNTSNHVQRTEVVRHSQNDQEKEKLRKAIEELNRERDKLREELQAAKDAEMAKSGEIAIVRENIDRKTKEHQRAVHSLNSSISEEREKYRQELASVRAEIERLKTDNAFLKNDMDIIVKKNRSDRVKLEPVKQRQGSLTVDLLRPDSPSTPRKNKGFDYQDGFNDREMRSPSKAPRVGPRTPSSRQGSKRKRNMQDSPLFELPLSQNRTPVAEQPQSHTQTVDPKILDRLYLDEENLEFYEFFIARKSQILGLSTLESLATFRLPSAETNASLSTSFIEAFSETKSEIGDEDLLATIARAVLAVWGKCLNEAFYAPLSLLVELLESCLEWASPKTVLQFSDLALKLIQQTVDLVAYTRIKKEPLNPATKDINIESMLKLMYNIGNLMHVEEDLKLRYWKKIRMDFPYMTMEHSQEAQDIKVMVQIMQLGIWSDGFGPRQSTGLTPRQAEAAVLERMGKLLNEDPTLSSTDTCPQKTLISMRLEIIAFLGALVQTSRGLEAVAEHPSLLCRLVCRISDEVDEMYRFRGGVSLSVSFINGAVRLLHGVLMLRPLDLAEKLSRIPGTTHKYMSSMSRIAFSEGLVQEAGLDPEIVDRAYGLVEVAVTPEEGEALESLFRRRD